LLGSSKVVQLAMSDRQLCRATKLCDKVARLCCRYYTGLNEL